MSMNLNLGVRAITALSYVLLLALSGGAGVKAHDGGSHAVKAALQPSQASGPAGIEDQSVGEMVLGGSPLLLGMALCGYMTGALSASLVRKTERALRGAELRRFAAAAATAIPTIGVRLGSSTA